jgi:ATP-dependent Clp protease ATP-binding subunit ClpC
MSKLYSKLSIKSIEYARDEAIRLGSDCVGTEHLLLGLIKLGEGKVFDIFNNLKINPNDITFFIKEDSYFKGTMEPGTLPITFHSKNVLELSGDEASGFGSKDIDPEHIVGAA